MRKYPIGVQNSILWVQNGRFWVKIRNFGLEGDFGIVTANLHICRGILTSDYSMVALREHGSILICKKYTFVGTLPPHLPLPHFKRDPIFLTDLDSMDLPLGWCGE